MAFSATKVKEERIGTIVMQIYNLNFASVTSGSFKTGLRNIIHANFNNFVTEDAGLVKHNHTGSVAEQGTMSIAAVTSNDTGTLIVYGA